MGEKKDRNKIFNTVIYTAGTAALVIMLSLSAANFVRDARVLKLPVLSNAAAVNKEANTAEGEDYKTLKYKKPVETATPKPKKTPVPKSTAASTPKPTPEPTRAPEP